MKKLLFLSLFSMCCSSAFSYQNINVDNLYFTFKDPYTLSKSGDKTTIRHKDIIVSVIQLDKDPQTAGAYANAIVTRLKDKDIVVSHIENKINKNNVKYAMFTSIDSEAQVVYAIVKKPEEIGYILACNKKEYDKDNLCEIMIDSLKIK